MGSFDTAPSPSVPDVPRGVAAQSPAAFGGATAQAQDTISKEVAGYANVLQEARDKRQALDLSYVQSRLQKEAAEYNAQLEQVDEDGNFVHPEAARSRGEVLREFGQKRLEAYGQEGYYIEPKVLDHVAKTELQNLETQGLEFDARREAEKSVNKVRDTISNDLSSFNLKLASNPMPMTVEQLKGDASYQRSLITMASLRDRNPIMYRVAREANSNLIAGAIQDALNKPGTPKVNGYTSAMGIFNEFKGSLTASQAEQVRTWFNEAKLKSLDRAVQEAEDNLSQVNTPGSTPSTYSAEQIKQMGVAIPPDMQTYMSGLNQVSEYVRNSTDRLTAVAQLKKYSETIGSKFSPLGMNYANKLATSVNNQISYWSGKSDAEFLDNKLGGKLSGKGLPDAIGIRKQDGTFDIDGDASSLTNYLQTSLTAWKGAGGDMANTVPFEQVQADRIYDQFLHKSIAAGDAGDLDSLTATLMSIQKAGGNSNLRFSDGGRTLLGRLRERASKDMKTDSFMAAPVSMMLAVGPVVKDASEIAPIVQGAKLGEVPLTEAAATRVPGVKKEANTDVAASAKKQLDSLIGSSQGWQEIERLYLDRFGGDNTGLLTAARKQAVNMVSSRLNSNEKLDVVNAINTTMAAMQPYVGFKDASGHILLTSYSVASKFGDQRRPLGDPRIVSPSGTDFVGEGIRNAFNYAGNRATLGGAWSYLTQVQGHDALAYMSGLGLMAAPVGGKITKIPGADKVAAGMASAQKAVAGAPVVGKALQAIGSNPAVKGMSVLGSKVMPWLAVASGTEVAFGGNRYYPLTGVDQLYLRPHNGEVSALVQDIDNSKDGDYGFSGDFKPGSINSVVGFHNYNSATKFNRGEIRDILANGTNNGVVSMKEAYSDPVRGPIAHVEFTDSNGVVHTLHKNGVAVEIPTDNLFTKAVLVSKGAMLPEADSFAEKKHLEIGAARMEDIISANRQRAALRTSQQ